MMQRVVAPCFDVRLDSLRLDQPAVLKNDALLAGEERLIRIAALCRRFWTASDGTDNRCGVNILHTLEHPTIGVNLHQRTFGAQPHASYRGDTNPAAQPVLFDRP
jgi:hypothetical protein